MAKRLTRRALYDLVWSEPMMTLSVQFQISDVALKKTCARAGISTPERGNWAKKDVGKEVFQAAFPLCPPGMSDEIEIGAGCDTRRDFPLSPLLVPLRAWRRDRSLSSTRGSAVSVGSTVESRSLPIALRARGNQTSAITANDPSPWRRSNSGVNGRWRRPIGSIQLQVGASTR